MSNNISMFCDHAWPAICSRTAWRFVFSLFFLQDALLNLNQIKWMCLRQSRASRRYGMAFFFLSLLFFSPALSLPLQLSLQIISHIQEAYRCLPNGASHFYSISCFTQCAGLDWISSMHNIVSCFGWRIMCSLDFPKKCLQGSLEWRSVWPLWPRPPGLREC